MRLPWWPIYVDARFDEQGVYYAIDDEPEQHVPWHRVKCFYQNSAQLFALYDDQGCFMQSGRARLFLRVKPKQEPEAKTRAYELQKAYIENSENQYACKVEWMNQTADQVFRLVLSIGLPIMFLVMMIQGYNSVPDNDPGIRVQNVILIGIVALILLALFINWRIYKGIHRHRKASRIIEVNQHGVVTNKSDYPWDEINRIDQQFIGFIAVAKTGQDLLLPSGGCATMIAHQRITQLPVFGYKLFFICLGIGIVSGPLLNAWFNYLIPDHDPSINFWAISLIITIAVLALFSLVYYQVWQAKRQESKSQ